MGLGRAFLDDLIALKRNGAIDGARRVAEIGAQQLADSVLEADSALAELHALFKRPRVDLGRPCGENNFTRQAPSSRPFWTSLGLSVTAIDYDGHRDSIALDLNSDATPDDLRGTFDLIVNAGTSEHVANQDNCFRVMHDLTRVGGVMYHEVPAGSWNHGLVNYTPKFFLLLHKQNDYEVVLMRERTDNDATIRAAFIKRAERPFATPLDVPPQLMPAKYRQPWRMVRRIARLP